ncbi:MAG: helix-turn-helix transcriptional regulator [Bacteroidales bacterium]|nr:helix-turn-helix transcriptional regulator [Bacteroidales bacterium]
MEIIEEQGYTQTEFAKAVGVSKTTLNRYLRKERMPSIRFIINVSYELNIDFMDLIDFGGRIE